MITEEQLEQLCLNWFQSIGYETVCGYDIAPDGDIPERVDYRLKYQSAYPLNRAGTGDSTDR